MWKLKIAEGANGNPYLYSTNNFIGRQTWKFDPNAGTPDERAEVEAARQNFFENRFEVKPISDLLWRMQSYIYTLVCSSHDVPVVAYMFCLVLVFGASFLVGGPVDVFSCGPVLPFMVLFLYFGDFGVLVLPLLAVI
ncbi:hypothetical protein QYF36_019428 [Acer negundo]|nr:hypothetical protein QYF36_019428 [Acer negundo]